MAKDEGAAFRTRGKGRWVRNDRIELPYFCHFMLGEEAGIGNWRVCNDFRFFTPLRRVQDDREGALWGVRGNLMGLAIYYGRHCGKVDIMDGV